jgi:hypothetical protein
MATTRHVRLSLSELQYGRSFLYRCAGSTNYVLDASLVGAIPPSMPLISRF